MLVWCVFSFMLFHFLLKWHTGFFQMRIMKHIQCEIMKSKAAIITELLPVTCYFDSSVTEPQVALLSSQVMSGTIGHHHQVVFLYHGASVKKLQDCVTVKFKTLNFKKLVSL
jgi:hypothetical protein